jgi:hypothetical protein
MENTDTLVQMALKALSPEEQAEYKKMGEHMYSDLSQFTGKSKTQPDSGNNSNNGDNSNNDMFKESAAYIESGIKSGLLVSDLEDNEIEVLKAVYGEKWYLRFGYKESDLKKE